MLATRAATMNDEQATIDPTLLLALPGSWIPEDVPQPVRRAEHHSHVLHDREGSESDAVHGLGIRRADPTLPEYSYDGDTSGWEHIQHWGGREEQCVPLQLSPTLSPGAPVFPPRDSSSTLSPLQTIFQEPPFQELAAVEKLGHANRGSKTPVIQVNGASQVQRVDGAAVDPATPKKVARPRGHSAPGCRPPKKVAGSKIASFPLPQAGSIDQDSDLLSPLVRFVQGPYHAGDRSALLAVNNSTAVPPSHTPDQNIRHAPSTPSPPTRTRGPYRCDHDGCKGQDIAFDTGSALRQHQRKHLTHEQRPHGCPDCRRRFHFPKDVRRHSKVHQSDPVICTVCNKPLSRGDNLARHLASQHNMAETPSMASESSAGSPVSPSVSSEAAYSYASPPSTGLSAAWSPTRATSHTMQPKPSSLGDPDVMFFLASPRTLPTSVPMARGRTN